MLILLFTYLYTVGLGFFPVPTEDTIRLDNPSFEGSPQDATTPTGWISCGENSTPDLLPGFWGVYTSPSDGNSYIGLIAREDGTWEAIGQKLNKPLKNKECYTFSVDLARSTTYAGYNIPVKLRIWGGSKRCSRDQILSESPIIKHTSWKTYNFEINPTKDYSFIILEVQYASGIYFTYKGNLLLDNCSAFKRCARASL
jgi:Carbohydrate binding domain